MSDSEFSDGMEELQDLIAEYENKEKKCNAPTMQGAHAATMATEKILKNSLEVPMDKVLFGDKEGLIKNLALAVGRVKEEEDEDDIYNDSSTAILMQTKKRKAVWKDEDDEEIRLGEMKRENKYNAHLPRDGTYKEFLAKRFTRIVSQPKWANLDNENTAKHNMDSDDEELLRTVGFLSKRSRTDVLSATFLAYKKQRDLNRASYAEGIVRSVQFHPTSAAALVAGESGVASIYALDGEQNEKLHNIYFEQFAIKHARITPCGTKAIFSAGKGHYFHYDLLVAKETRFPIIKKIKYINRFEISPCGRYLAFATQYGLWHLFDAVCSELIHTFQQEHTVVNLIFTADSQRVICVSNTNEVCIYSLKQRKLEHKFFDDGCIIGNVLDLAPNQRLLATGSREGAVNVYDFEKVLSSTAPKPEKTFLNLTTGISCVKFNHTSELLAMSSNTVKSAVRLAHFPSATVFANFPKEKEVSKISIMEFSPSSGYLALGGFEKMVHLFRLTHYKNY